jgi:hypothetical protein
LQQSARFLSLVAIMVCTALAFARPAVAQQDLPGEGILRRVPVATGEDFVNSLVETVPGTAIELPLFEDISVEAVAERVEKYDGGVSWVGKDERYEIGDMMFSIRSESLVGTINETRHTVANFRHAL